VENFSVENLRFMAFQNRLWKTEKFSTAACGEKSAAALRKNGLFHIKILYYNDH